MKIVVKLFALVRERAGKAELAIELPDGATVREARTALAAVCPAIADILPRAAFAVNRAYALPGVALVEGDEVAVIPPVSGG